MIAACLLLLLRCWLNFKLGFCTLVMNKVGLSYFWGFRPV
jgi:hypothetical protein